MNRIDSESARTADDPALQPATLGVHAGIRRSEFQETSEALFLTSGFVYDTAQEAARAFAGESERFVYSRYRNPTVEMFQDRLCRIGGGAACVATASGMSAVFTALLALLKSGDRLVASRAIFGSCAYVCGELLPRFGIETVFVDATDMAAWQAALAVPTRAVFLETPSNPGLDIVDLAAVAALARRAGAKLVVDNAFASPVLQRPFDFGADVVVYSATKHIDGQGRCMGGAIVGDQAFKDDGLAPLMRHTGPCMSPFNAWVLLKGLETLDLRVRHQSRNALILARALESHPGLLRTLHPFLDSHRGHDTARAQMSLGGNIVTFEVAGGRERAFAVLDRLRLIRISNNLGDAKSLITHPASTTHQRLSAEERARIGITEGMVRLSVGLEAVEDLIADLTRALG